MAKFCLPKEIADKLKRMAEKGEIDIAKMYEMTSKQRREMFQKWVSEGVAKNINAEFEKAMSSDQQTALQTWAENTFSGKQKARSSYRDVLDKIDSLNELGLLDGKNEDAFLSDLVASKLGASITAEEASTISIKASELKTLSEKKTEFGTPTIEYFKKRREMENYMDSITPSSRLKILTSIIGRGSMLASPKSTFLNIESNTINGFLQLAERRITDRQISGVNSSYAVKYMKFVNKVYKETSYDLTRMRSLETRRKILGEDVPTTQGKGKVRAVGRIYEDIVFKTLLGAPDVAFASVHFADTVNLMSTNIARKQGFKGAKLESEALKLFKDATKIQPETPNGKLLREQAIGNAELGTYTQDSTYADIGLGIRKVFNLASGDLRLGDNLIPFVKTPANVIGLGLDSTGVPLVAESTIKMFKVLSDIKKGTKVNEAVMQNYSGMSRKFVRAGLGMTFAYLLSSLFEPDDFIGEYPVSQKERELLRLKNATTNSVKIGGKWYSLDYFSALGSPLVAMLYAKKYGNNFSSKAFYYTKGAVVQATKIPGLEQLSNLYADASSDFDSKNNNLEENLNVFGNVITDFVRARIQPAFVYDVARTTDKYDRKVDYTNPAEKIKSTIPGLRQTLSIKKNAFGEEIKGEGLKVMLFGSRVKTASDTLLVNEMSRLAETGNLPSITDPSKTSSRAKDLKRQIGNDKYEEALTFFTDTLRGELTDLVQSDFYFELEDTEKQNIINNIKTDVLDYMLAEYQYEPAE